jgi:hypothetical protein
MLSFKKFLIENKNNFSFPIQLLKNNRGEIGRQGLSAETISGMLNDIAGIDNKNSNVMQSLETFKKDKDAQNKFLSFVEKNPISVKEMPDDEGFHLKDGHHRAYLVDYIGQKNIPTKLETVNSNPKSTVIQNTKALGAAGLAAAGSIAGSALTQGVQAATDVIGMVGNTPTGKDRMQIEKSFNSDLGLGFDLNPDGELEMNPAGREAVRKRQQQGTNFPSMFEK